MVNHNGNGYECDMAKLALIWQLFAHSASIAPSIAKF